MGGAGLGHHAERVSPDCPGEKTQRQRGTEGIRRGEPSKGDWWDCGVRESHLLPTPNVERGKNKKVKKKKVAPSRKTATPKKDPREEQELGDTSGGGRRTQTFEKKVKRCDERKLEKRRDSLQGFIPSQRVEKAVVNTKKKGAGDAPRIKGESVRQP